MELRAEPDDAQNLQADERNEEIKIELVVLKHEARWEAKLVPVRGEIEVNVLSNVHRRKAVFSAHAQNGARNIPHALQTGAW